MGRAVRLIQPPQQAAELPSGFVGETSSGAVETAMGTLGGDSGPSTGESGGGSGSCSGSGSGSGSDGGGRALLDFPDAMLSEIFASLSLKGLGCASCACRRLRDTGADERLWVALWEGPLPGWCSSGVKAAHAALWLLAHGEVEQTRVAICEPPSPARNGGEGCRLGAHDRRITSRRRVGEVVTVATSSDSAPSTARGRGHGAGGGSAGGSSGGGGAVGAGFPVHVSCMAISGGIIAAAAGSEITVWDMEEAAVPRSRFNVSGHGSVTCLLLRHGTLLAGDNSGYLRCYDLDVAGGQARHQIRTHADRVTAMDAFTLPDSGSSIAAGDPGGEAQRGSIRSSGNRARHYSVAGSASVSAAGDGAGCGGDGGAGRQQRRWDQGHGWGDGWLADSSGEQENVRSGEIVAAATGLPVVPQRGSSSTSGWGGPPPPHAPPSSGAERARGMVGFGRGRGRSGGFGRGHQGEPCVRGTAVTGSGAGYGSGGVGGGGGLNEGPDRRYRSMHGGGGCVGDGLCAGAFGEPTSRLGKRQGYAGRGQGDEPADAVASSSPVQPEREAMATRSAWDRGGGVDGSGIGQSNCEVLSAGTVASAWDEEENKENDEQQGEEGKYQSADRRAERRRRGCGDGRGVGRVGGREREEGSVEKALLFTGSDDGTAKAWDAASGQLARVYAGHTRGVTCLQAEFTESYGPVLVTGGGDSAVIIWELTTGRCLEKLETGTGLVFNPGGVGPRVGCLQAYRDSIVVGEDRHVSVWSLRKGKRPQLSRASFCEHQRPIRRLDVVGRWIVTCSGDYVIRLWDSKTGLCVRELGTKSGAAITSFRLSRGPRLLTTSLFDASVLMTSFLPPSAPERLV